MLGGGVLSTEEGWGQRTGGCLSPASRRDAGSTRVREIRGGSAAQALTGPATARHPRYGVLQAGPPHPSGAQGCPSAAGAGGPRVSAVPRRARGRVGARVSVAQRPGMRR